MSSVRIPVLAAAIASALAGNGVSADLIAASPATQKTLFVAESPVGRYLITFTEPGLVEYQGGISGLSRTAPSSDLVSAAASRKFNAATPAAAAYKAYLAHQRAAYVKAIEMALGHALAISYVYDVARHAVSAELDPAEASRVAHMTGVASVAPIEMLQTDTFRGPKFIGANTIWDGSDVPSYATATRGEGVKVGVLDTGSYAAHPSFANDATCGFSTAHPKLTAKDCTSTSDCTGPSPEADSGNGHGVHTASTAAGNTIDNTVIPAPLLPDGITMSGVAPCAEVHTYKVCATTGCAGDAIHAGIQTAIVDQVDVLNFSAGAACGRGDPWTDPIELDFLSAEVADIFVAASAGNIAGGCQNPVGLVTNNGPWVTTVAASTQDQVLAPTFSVTGPGTPPPLTQNILLISGSSTLPPAQLANFSNMPILVNQANLLGCSSSGGFPAGFFTGTVAVIQRGTCTFVEKITNAYNAGARRVLITNNTSGSIGMDTTNLDPTIAANIAAFSTEQAPGDALIAFAEANAGAVGDYHQSDIAGVAGDILAGFSLRGPTSGSYADLTKPDITGPGVNIYAALDAGSGNYGLESGTSMSSPHLAGSAALVRAVHPDWTPMEVKSALQTTAVKAGTQEDGVKPWTPDQVGSGRVDLSKATLAGLTLDETQANFLNAGNPAPPTGTSDVVFIDGFDPVPSTSAVGELNLASLRNTNCRSSCAWTRTLKNRLQTSGTWTINATDPRGYHLTIQPATFTLAPGATQTITVTATVTGVPAIGVYFGSVDLLENSNQSPDQHLTVAVTNGDIPTVSCGAGNCSFQIDAPGASVNGWGCTTGWSAGCQELWLNRFSPDQGDYPITLTSVQVPFLSDAGWNAIGDQISIYVYQDDDANPSNGATPLHAQSYTQSFLVNGFSTISLNPPVVLNGPGDVLIALANPYPTNSGGVPAVADNGPFAQRSWVGKAVPDSNGTLAPDLSSAAVELRRNDDPVVAFPYTWFIRAKGTNVNGQSVTLDPVDR